MLAGVCCTPQFSRCTAQVVDIPRIWLMVMYHKNSQTLGDLISVEVMDILLMVEDGFTDWSNLKKEMTLKFPASLVEHCT